MTLSWIEYHKTLPDNYELSHQRLKGLLHHLQQNSAMFEQYDRIIKDQIQQGIVELAPDTSWQPTVCHYLPNHPVIWDDKKASKLRIVYDASARMRDRPSLNDCIYKGPKFNQRILDILLCFQGFRVPLMADLEKAFLQVSIADAGRDVLRFL